MDLSLEHLLKGDIHNARFSLMLTDNAVELILHQIAVDQQDHLRLSRWQNEKYARQKALDKALLRNFSDKVRFGRIAEKISLLEANTIDVMHEFRNELYHVGLSHEEILPALSRFYFFTACKVIGRYKPRYNSWGSRLIIPERAKKYFKPDRFGAPGSSDQFQSACEVLAKGCGHEDGALVGILADQVDRIIKQQDVCIGIVADGVYQGQQRTRDRSIIESQAWSMAFTDEGRAFILRRNWSGSILAAVDFLADNYPFKFNRDPIPSWQKQAKNLRTKRDCHAALAHYNSFMLETADLRGIIEQSARAAEAEIDSAIEHMRGN